MFLVYSIYLIIIVLGVLLINETRKSPLGRLGRILKLIGTGGLICIGILMVVGLIIVEDWEKLKWLLGVIGVATLVRLINWARQRNKKKKQSLPLQERKERELKESKSLTIAHIFIIALFFILIAFLIALAFQTP